MYNFVILIDLSHVSMQDNNYQFLLDLFGSYINSLEFTILSLSLSTKVQRNANKYLIYYKSPTKTYESIKSPLISVFGSEHKRYKTLTSSKNFFTIGNNTVMLITDQHVKYMLY